MKIKRAVEERCENCSFMKLMPARCDWNGDKLPPERTCSFFTEKVCPDWEGNGEGK